jgi:hypothetical protein
MTRAILYSMMLVTLVTAACGPNQRIINSAQENRAESTAAGDTANVAPAQGSLERDVNAMRNADFNFIYIIRRQDGAILDSGDKTFITSASREMNRRTVSDTGKAVIIGSNFRMPAASLDSLKQRFTIEDLSKPESEIQPVNR